MKPIVSLLGVAVLFLAYTTVQPQEAAGPVTVKIHEPKTEITEVILPVDPNPRIQINGVTQMNFGLMVDNTKWLCCGQGAIRTNFKIDGQVVYPNNNPQQALPPGPFNKKRIGHQVVFQLNNVNITQTVEVVPSKPSKGDGKRHLDTALISYTVENKSDRPRSVGVRVRIDTMCGNNDGALFAAPTMPNKVLNGVELKDKTLPEFVQILENPDLKNPGFVGHYTLKMSGKYIGPNRFLCTTHGIGDNGWDVAVQQANGDSDSVVYWDPREIKPGSKIEYAYAYGRGIATLPENEGRVRLEFGGSFEAGKLFSITAYVEEPITSQSLTLELPPGLQLVEGREIMPVPSPSEGNATSVVLWKARVLRYGDHAIRIRSSNGVTQTRTVSITPAQAKSAGE
ncbi:MAG: hypothetical protein L0219_22205 [Phycisphaerales bacterium]|nr:hypothetical protein [Phycisphaerales bacterium]